MTYANPCKGTIHAYDPKKNANLPDGVARVTQPFHRNPMLVEGVWVPQHLAIDIGFGRSGDPILAARAGRVYRAGFEPPPDNALNVFIEHADGMATQYGHCRDEIVSVGQNVTAGKLIAHVGSTGHVSGPHIHFSIFRATEGVDSAVDPWPLLAQNQPAKTVRLRKLDGINVRREAKVNGAAYAQTDAGQIIRADGKNLGPSDDPRKWGGRAKGGTYTVAGKTGDTWERLWLDSAYRFVASPLAVVEGG